MLVYEPKKVSSYQSEIDALCIDLDLVLVSRSRGSFCATYVIPECPVLVKERYVAPSLVVTPFTLYKRNRSYVRKSNNDHPVLSLDWD